MLYKVYILKSLKDNGYYIGCTSNLEQRLNEHNQGKTRSIVHRRPFEVVYVEEFDDKDDAYNREKQIKKYKGGNAFKKLIS